MLVRRSWLGATTLAVMLVFAVSTFALAQALGAAFLGTITDFTLTVTRLNAGALAVGQTVTGPGVTSGTVIVGLGSGNGGTGTYTVSIPQTIVISSLNTVAQGAVDLSSFIANAPTAGPFNPSDRIPVTQGDPPLLYGVDPATFGTSGGALPTYGLIGDAIESTGITTTAGSVDFGGILLAVGDVGKTIIVPGAGTNGAAHITTVASPSSFAVAAANAVPATFFAEAGKTVPVVVAQSGLGSYMPGDVITLAGGTGTVATEITIQYTKVTAISIVSGGSGCVDGVNRRFSGTTGSGNPWAANFTISGGVAITMTGIVGGGFYRITPTIAGDTAQLGGGCDVYPVLSLTTGVAIARVSREGVYTVAPTGTIAQASTSGFGTGASFTLGYTQSEAFTYGTDNSVALAALFARGDSPKATLAPGAYLYNCGTYAAASSLSLSGAGAGVSVLKLFPNCVQSGNLLSWTGRHGVSVEGITFDLSRAINVNLATPPISGVIFRDSDNINLRNNAIINLPNLWNGIGIAAITDGVHGGVIDANYIYNPAPDTTFNEGITVSTIGGVVTGLTVSKNRIVGTGTQFCMQYSVVSDNEISAFNFGAGIFTLPGNAACTDVIFSNNIVRDGETGTLDVNQTAAVGYEMHGYRMQMIGNIAVNNGGQGFSCWSEDSRWIGNRALDNGGTLPARDGSGFRAHGYTTDPGNSCTGAYFEGNTSRSSGVGKQLWGYDEVWSEAAGTVNFGVNNFSGQVVGTVGGATNIGSKPSSTLYSAQVSGQTPFACDGQRGATGSITAGSRYFTYTVPEASMRGDDIGKPIIIFGAGAAGVPLITTITASAGERVTQLAVAASTTVSGAKWGRGSDYTAIINAALSTPGVTLPRGNCGHTSPLTLANQSHLRGQGASTNLQSRTVLMWLGAAGGTQITGGGTVPISGLRVGNFTLDGMCTAAIGMQLRGVQGSQFDPIHALGHTETAYDFDAGSTAGATFSDNDLYNLRAAQTEACSPNTVGLKTGLGNASGNGVNDNNFYGLNLATTNGAALSLANASNNSIFGYTSAPTGTGLSIDFNGSNAGSDLSARRNYFYRARPAGGVTARGTGLAFPSNNNYLHLATPSTVTIETGASLQCLDQTGANTCGSGLGATRFGSTLSVLQASPAVGAACTAGQIAVDTGFIYTCSASGAWKRVAVAAY